MPSETPVSPQPTEKPHHYTYLKEFRTQQCPLFLQHKCNQHRPFTCFHWHFMNQRRRRPVRRREGVFNYSPDVYCTKYDETTGICPEGDDCPYLHRTAGDTERRYHLRYYKTCTCVYETDARGQCVKNGQHCAFAHGAQDLRPPVYDVRELQALDALDKQGQAANVADSPLGTSLEKDRIINEDPKWNDTNYVLANYKTDQCKRPPRLCRQGYACPSYHNSRDKRRSPKKIKYRSTPCPNVKHGDDWGDPAQCDSGENCPYCHTRTEQQFHPEIYKSTKCNDMVQTGYCPRGPFCAFAHVEQEMTTQRELSAASDNSLAAFVTNALPDPVEDKENQNDDQMEENHIESKNENNNGQGIFPVNPNREDSSRALSSSFNGIQNFPEPIGKGRTSSVSSSFAECSLNYQRAPGSEREDPQTKLRQQILAIENDYTLDQAEKAKRKQNLLLLHNLNSGNGALSPNLGTSPVSNTATPSFNLASTMSPNAPSFYPPGDIVDSVIGNALEEDPNIGELNLADLHLKSDNDNDTNSVCSSLSTGFPSSGSYLGATSVPVTIPSSTGYYPRNSLGSLSQSPSSSPMGSVGQTFIPQHVTQEQRQEQQLHEAAAAFLSQPNPGKFSAPGFTEFTSSSMSPRSNSIPPSPMIGSGSVPSSPFMVNGYCDVSRLREELAANKAKLSQWEDGISQARNACEAWKKEAEESTRRMKTAEEERIQAVKQRDEAVSQMSKVKVETDVQRGGSIPKALNKGKELEGLPLTQLQQLQQQLRLELELIEKAIFKSATVKCILCREKNRSIRVLPCNHYVLCDLCAAKSSECPYCHAKIAQRNPANLVF